MTSPPLEMEFEGRRLDPERDLREVGLLYEQVFGYRITRDIWVWKYLPRWTPRHYCYVGTHAGAITGFFGAVPLRGIWNGEEIAVFQLADLMVHPKYRRQQDYFGIGQEKILADIESHHDKRLIYGFSGHKAYLYFIKKQRGGLIEKNLTRYARVANAPQDKRFEIVPWGWGHSGINRIWRRFAPEIRMGLVRDEDYLSWRYGMHPIYNYRLFGVLESGAPIGWCVIGADKPGTGGRAKEIPVVDMLLDQDDAPRVLHELAAHLDNDVMAWLPQRLMRGKFDEEVEGKTHCYHMTVDTVVDTKYLREHLYYTMGDIDWW